MNLLISALLRGPWLIDPKWAQSQLPFVNSLLEGKSSISNKVDEIGLDQLPKISHIGSGTLTSVLKAGKWGADFSNAHPGSIAIIPINGPIMKYNGECGEPGSIARASWIKAADESPNISSIVILFDTPGGQVDGTQTLANTIKNSKTPIIGFVDDGICASAGVWMASGCRELYAGLKTDTIGSIGVFTRLIDAKGAYEALGFKIHEIYAPQSTEKSLDYRKALEGDYSLIQKELEFIASEFISAVKVNRKGKLSYTKDNDPFKGAMFNAEEAVEIGLIDGIKSFEEVLILADQSGKNKNSKNAQINNNTDMNLFGKKNKAIESLKGKKAEEISNEELESANSELAESGISSVVLVTTATQSEIATTAKNLETAQQTIESTKTTIKEAGFDSLEALITSNEQWKEKAISYGAKPAEETTAAVKGAESEITTKETTEMSSWEKKAAKLNEY